MANFLNRISCNIGVFLLCVAAISVGGCRNGRDEMSHKHHDDAPSQEVDASAHSHHSPSQIVIQPAMAEKLGIRTVAVGSGGFEEVVAVSGSIEPSPTGSASACARSAGLLNFAKGIAPGVQVHAGQVIASVSGRGMAGGDATEAASTRLAAAKRELDRLAPLHAEGIVTTREYNEALSNYEVARAAAGSSRRTNGSSVTAPVSGVITGLNVSEGQAVDVGDAVASISSSDEVLLRANLPVSMSAEIASFTDADFRMNGSEEVLSVSGCGGRRLVSSNQIAQDGFVPVYFILKSASVVPGSFCEVFLKSGRMAEVLSVPVSALSEQQGAYFVYVQVHDDAFEKRPVSLGRWSASAVEVASGLMAGEKIVSEGLTFVRLAEISGVSPEGHSHNH